MRDLFSDAQKVKPKLIDFKGRKGYSNTVIHNLGSPSILRLQLPEIFGDPQLGTTN